MLRHVRVLGPEAGMQKHISYPSANCASLGSWVVILSNQGLTNFDHYLVLHRLTKN